MIVKYKNWLHNVENLMAGLQSGKTSPGREVSCSSTLSLTSPNTQWVRIWNPKSAISSGILKSHSHQNLFGNLLSHHIALLIVSNANITIGDIKVTSNIGMVMMTSNQNIYTTTTSTLSATNYTTCVLGRDSEEILLSAEMLHWLFDYTASPPDPSPNLSCHKETTSIRWRLQQCYVS